MQKNSDNFSIQDLMRLANSPAGKQLISLLQQADPGAIANAKSQASSGNYAQAAQSLAPFLASEEVQKLMQQLGG